MQHHRLYLKIVCTPRPRSTRRKGSLATPVDQLICFTYERHVPEFDLNRLLLWNLRGVITETSVSSSQCDCYPLRFYWTLPVPACV
ncbi:unnamed protein product [Acanthoscelides obtectus]|uniref:Uncharacterized protein n=1 Tax=Acanthoscelides obtectus TaxID=200917 RepID=A0A9P0L1J1_ACAOB|nr:unnamed protein product [Acanthoscelides obtectus]CAK1646018.1 hypothetical protein AOBTE_LOCUS14400 [Acanthoscelides obtectus]